MFCLWWCNPKGNLPRPTGNMQPSNKLLATPPLVYAFDKLQTKRHVIVLFEMWGTSQIMITCHGKLLTRTFFPMSSQLETFFKLAASFETRICPVGNCMCGRTTHLLNPPSGLHLSDRGYVYLRELADRHGPVCRSLTHYDDISPLGNAKHSQICALSVCTIQMITIHLLYL